MDGCTVTGVRTAHVVCDLEEICSEFFKVKYCLRWDKRMTFDDLTPSYCSNYLPGYRLETGTAAELRLALTSLSSPLTGAIGSGKTLVLEQFQYFVCY